MRKVKASEKSVSGTSYLHELRGVRLNTLTNVKYAESSDSENTIVFRSYTTPYNLRNQRWVDYRSGLRLYQPAAGQEWTKEQHQQCLQEYGLPDRYTPRELLMERRLEKFGLNLARVLEPSRVTKKPSQDQP